VSGYTIAWIVWGLAFAGIEGTAIVRRNSAGTLSDHIWSWFAVNNKPRGWQIRRVALVGGLAVLVVHLIGGGNVI